MMAKFTTENAATYGRKGGQRTVERYGRDHMARIGVRGFWRTVERHWCGNAGAFVNFLIMMGRAATDPVPQNGAFTHDRKVMRVWALAGVNFLRPSWRAPAIPDDLDSEIPF